MVVVVVQLHPTISMAIAIIVVVIIIIWENFPLVVYNPHKNKSMYLLPLSCAAAVIGVNYGTHTKRKKTQQSQEGEGCNIKVVANLYMLIHLLMK